MAATSNVPRVSFTDRGFIAPTETAILAGRKADFTDAFGPELNMDDSTPQGQLAVSDTAIIGAADTSFCFVANQVDPAFSQGRMQDAIARIYFIERLPALPTIVEALCSGLPGVVIPAGAIATANDGSTYSCTNGGVIQAGGTVTLTFAATIPGPTPCPAGSLTSIFVAIPGWDSITNSDDGIIGNDVESREAFEERRGQSVAGNSFGAAGSIIGAVSKVAGVLDFFDFDNSEDSPVTKTGVTIDANSIYICVAGGTDEAVASAILSKKAPGCAYTGNTDVTVYDTNPLYSAPVPYLVSFQRPDDLAILFAVNIAAGPLVPSDAATQIQNAIIAAFAGSDGAGRARIGDILYASRFYNPVSLLGPWVRIVSLLVGSNNATGATFTAGIADTLMTVSAVGSGALAVGQTISGAGVIEGTTIISQDSGSAGSTGTYTVSISQTVTAPVAMKAAKATLNDLQVNIDQIPTVGAANIIVTIA